MFKTSFGAMCVAVAALVTAIVLAACAPPTPVQQFTLRFPFLATVSNLPYFVMQEQGFAKQNGIQFDETSSAGAGIIDSMIASSVDVGYVPSVGAAGVLAATERGLIPGTVVPVAANTFTDRDHPSMAVLVAASVNSWKDLEGQPIGTPFVKGIASAAMKVRLQQEGVRNYTFVEITQPNLGLAVAGGTAAAAIMSEPFLTQSLLRGDGKLLGWVIGGPPFERMEFDLVVFSASFYRNNSQAVKAFLRAHLQAVRWINQNPDAARSVLVKRLALTEEVGKKMSLPRWSLDARNDPALLEGMQPLLIEIGMLKALIPARQLYDETLLEQVLAEKR